MKKNILVIAGPTGSGKDTVIKEVIKKVPNANFLVNATSRKPRADEVDGKNYYFLSNEQFLKELENGNILEYYHRADTDTYYGTYKPDLLKKIEGNGIAIAQLQIVGAKFLKDNYNATTIFILPESLDIIEKRVRSRAEISDLEWAERLKHLEREVKEDVNFYDYKVTNFEGKLEDTVNSVIEIMKKEGFEVV
jgi:guanylate kinase